MISIRPLIRTDIVIPVTSAEPIKNDPKPKARRVEPADEGTDIASDQRDARYSRGGHKDSSSRGKPEPVVVDDVA